MSKKILFITGTRADFGKLKPLMKAAGAEPGIDANIFVTGMHMYPRYGNTGNEIEKSGFAKAFYYINQKPNDTMDTILANTIYGLEHYLGLLKPDMIVVHGDRIEALAGALVGALNNILVAHIEGGEVSGTIDESIRHAVSKLAHLHFVSNNDAKRRLIQMGENDERIFVVGSPDIDLMISKDLPLLADVKKHYEIPFNEYAIFIYHPVTTKLHSVLEHIRGVLSAVRKSGENYVIAYPNNDPGSDLIIEEYEQIRDNTRFRIFPSLRFEAFLVLLKNCKFIIGNSSAGIREAPFYGIPAVNIGNRQNGRYAHDSIINVTESEEEIMHAIKKAGSMLCRKSEYFGDGNSAERFIEILRSPETWSTIVQKYFVDQSRTADEKSAVSAPGI